MSHAQTSVLEKQPRAGSPSGLNFVLRAFYGCWDTDDAVASTIEFLERTGFAGIMFMPGYLLSEPNHLSQDVLETRSERMKHAARQFEERGFSVGLNIHTVGFTYSPPDTQPFGFHYEHGADGKPSDRSVCPLCTTFHRYLDRLLTALTVPGIQYILIDDDFNYMVWNHACYCPLHMAAYSKAVGRNVDRETWVREIQSPEFRPGPESEAWHRVQIDALLDCFKVIEQAVHRVDPSVRLGPMGINSWACDYGPDAMTKLFEIARGRGNTPPVSRPSSGFYWDWQRLPTHGVISHYAELYVRSVQPPDVTGLVEADIGAPWTRYDHGAEHVRYLLERTVALGSRNVAFLLSPDQPGDAIGADGPYAKMLRATRQKCDAVSELIGERAVFEGVDSRPAAGKGRVDPWSDHFYGIPAFALGRIGLPMAPTGEWVPVLYGKQPWLIGSDALGSYMLRGAIVDANAVHGIAQMGAGGLIGDADAIEPPAMPVTLQTSRHPLNGVSGGRHFSNVGAIRRECRVLSGNFDESEVLSWWLDSSFRRIGPAEAAIERDGRRMLLLSHALDQQTPERQLLVANEFRQQMWHNACEWIARGPLPAVVKDGVDIQLFFMRCRGGSRRVLTLVNNGFNRFETLTVQLAELPRPQPTILTVNDEGRIVAAAGAELTRLSDRWELRIPARLAPPPFEVRVLAIE